MTRVSLGSVFLALLALSLSPACGPGNPGGPGFEKYSELESADILGRSSSHPKVYVKHVLLGWDELEGNYGGRMDERSKKRSRRDAEKIVRLVVAELEKGTPIEPLMIEHSGDRGTADGKALPVEPDSNFVPRFKALSLRLAVGEYGVVQTSFGYHVIKRVK